MQIPSLAPRCRAEVDFSCVLSLSGVSRIPGRRWWVGSNPGLPWAGLQRRAWGRAGPRVRRGRRGRAGATAKTIPFLVFIRKRIDAQPPYFLPTGLSHQSAQQQPCSSIEVKPLPETSTVRRLRSSRGCVSPIVIGRLPPFTISRSLVDFEASNCG